MITNLILIFLGILTLLTPLIEVRFFSEFNRWLKNFDYFYMNLTYKTTKLNFRDTSLFLILANITFGLLNLFIISYEFSKPKSLSTIINVIMLFVIFKLAQFILLNLSLYPTYYEINKKLNPEIINYMKFNESNIENFTVYPPKLTIEVLWNPLNLIYYNEDDNADDFNINIYNKIIEQFKKSPNKSKLISKKINL